MALMMASENSAPLSVSAPPACARDVPCIMARPRAQCTVRTTNHFAALWHVFDAPVRHQQAVFALVGLAVSTAIR